jgi:molybdopterin molybdotransferase
MLELEVARERILAALPAPSPETVTVAKAQGRFLLESLVASVDLPPFDNSAFDGYAVRAEDVFTASPEGPVRLRIIGRAEAGKVFPGKLTPGSCVRLFTGAPLPDGADAVVMQEDSRVDPAASDTMLVSESAKPWEGVRLRGEDVRRGELIGQAGDRIRAGVQCLLSAAGIVAVQVGRQPVVRVLATGNELREPGETLPPGHIYESNRVALLSLARDAGATTSAAPLVRDSLKSTMEALGAALADSDLVVTSGGVSVGETDFVKEAFQQLGGEIELWRVAIKPGKPFVFGRRGAKILFGLPGNPVSAMVTFLLLVRPALLRWQGAAQVELTQRSGRLAEPFINRGDRRHFVRVTLLPDGRVHSAGQQASHALRSLASANGLVDVPPKTTLEAGVLVRVLCLDA